MKANNINNNNNNDNLEPEVLEQGDIYFFYRPKKNAEQIKGIEDIRRFLWLLPQKEQKILKRIVTKASFTGYLS
jgi:hypothetical protein